MPTARRSKPSLKTSPKHRQKLALKNRRRKAKQAAAHKRGLNRSRARRRTRQSRRGKLKLR
jgi:hypothetical protein